MTPTGSKPIVPLGKSCSELMALVRAEEVTHSLAQAHSVQNRLSLSGLAGFQHHLDGFTHAGGSYAKRRLQGRLQSK